MDVHSGTKNEPKPKLLSPDIFRWVWGSSHTKGWGPKSSVCPSKPRESNFFGGISRDFAGISRSCPKSLRKKKFGFNFRSLSMSHGPKAIRKDIHDLEGVFKIDG